MKNKIECPYCDGYAILKNEIKELSFRKETYKVRTLYYRCQKCREEFTNTETDTFTISQLYNQYREKHGIPFPEEIKALREQYGITAGKMSNILGLGINSYNNYEKGEIPSLANANLINAAKDPDVFMNLLEKTKNNFSANSYTKIMDCVDKVITDLKKFDNFSYAFQYNNNPNKYNGYKTPDLNKIIELTKILLNNCNAEYNDRLKLNKLLFYTDFYNYKKHGQSITGITYRAIQWGPVPANYDNIYALLENNNVLITVFRDDGKGGAKETFETSPEYDTSMFSEEEMKTIKEIIEKFKDSPTWEMVKLSHKERAWKELKDENKVISYQEYAFDLKGI